MKTSIFLAGMAALLLLVGCQSLPPGVERGPHNTMAYDVLVDASPPGARIRAEGSTTLAVLSMRSRRFRWRPINFRKRAILAQVICLARRTVFPRAFIL